MPELYFYFYYTSDIDDNSHTTDHHTGLDDHFPCDTDIDFTSSYTSFSSFWEIPANVKPYIVSVKWALEEHENADNG